VNRGSALAAIQEMENSGGMTQKMTNRITVFTKPWQEMSIAELGAFVRKLGFGGVELAIRPGYQVTPENMTRALPEAARILADQGVTIGSVAGPTDERAIAACAAAGCRIIRVCIGIDRKAGYRATEARVRREYDALVPLLKKHGVSIGVQNHCDFFVGSAIGVMHLIESYEPAMVSAVLDPAHCAVDGEPPEMAIDITWSHLSLVNMKSAFHLRKNGPNEVEAAWEIYWCTAQHAGFSWRATIDELRRRGYAGDICLPAEYTPPVGEGQLMGMDVVAPLRYDMAYLRFLLSDAAAAGTGFVSEEWRV
jgi:sugar phosphate isomerase/epimerase